MVEIGIKNPTLKVGFGTFNLSLDIDPNSKEAVENFVLGINPEKKYVAILKEKKDKRTLSQNSYYWSLNNQLAIKVGITPLEVYKEHIHAMAGIYDYVLCKTEAVESLIRNWQSNGDGWLAYDTGESKQVPRSHILKLYRGSSAFDTAEMSRLIDLLIMDCENAGIPTLKKEEIERLPLYD